MFMYQFTINKIGYQHKYNLYLMDYLRDHLHFTGTKNGCKEGVCGTCSVLIDGIARKSCIVTLESIHGKCITTIEGLDQNTRDIFVRAFSRAGAVQCGFCTPGFVISAISLYHQNPNPSREEVARAVRGHICRCTGYVKIIDGILLAFDDLNTKQQDEYLSATSQTHVLGRATLQIDGNIGLGMNLARIDAESKVLGTGKYVDDLMVEGMLYASAIRSAHPRARVLNINSTLTRKHEDFVAILTSDDVPGNNKIGHLEHISDWDVLLPIGEITRYVGDAIAIVVSKTKVSLPMLKDLVEVEYEVLHPLTTIQQAMAEDAPHIHKSGNILSTEFVKRGSVDEVLQPSVYQVTQRYTTPINEHAFLEPECAIALPQGEEGLLLYSGGQSIYDEQREIARMLGISKEKIQVKGQLIGGAFGGKEDMSVQHHAALVAWVLKSPVKLLFTRDESLLVHPKRHPMEITITTGCDEQGVLTGIKATILSDTGAYASLGGPVLQRACTHIMGPYRYHAVEIQGTAVYTNNPPAGAFRGFGVCQVAFASESNLNLLAKKVGISPHEIRIRNAIRPGDIMGNGQIATYNTAVLATLEAVKPIYESALRSGKAVGISSFHKNSGLGVGVTDIGRCILSIVDGKVHIRTSAACLGQGVGTVLTQIICETLQIPPSYVICESPDTKRTPNAGTTTASRQSLFTGEATRIAASKLLQAILQNKGKAHGLYATVEEKYKRSSGLWKDKIEYDAHIFSEMLCALDGEDFYGEYAPYTDPMHSDQVHPISHVAYGYATQVVILDGKGMIEAIHAAYDAGTIVNPLACEGQIEGGIVMGMGYALTEQFPLVSGYVKAKFARLGLLRADQIPTIEITFVQAPGLNDDVAYGIKGVGELATIPTAAAIAGAYYCKDGVLRTDLPLIDTPYSKESSEP